MLDAPVDVTLAMGRVLDALGVPWLVGGSVASSLHGVPRSTPDVDIVADLGREHIAPLVAGIEEAFYVSEDAAAEAVRRRASFNAIHLGTMYKVDVFAMRHATFF